MAIQVLRNLSQLLDQAKSLGLTPVPTKPHKLADGSYEKVFSKEDVIKCLRAYYLNQKSPEEKKMLELMLHIDSPMLCQQFKVLKPEEQKQLLDVDNNDWVAEEKLDGNRMLLFYIGGKFEAFSRNISVEDFLPVAYGDHILMEGIDLSKIKHDFIIDCEVISSNPNISTVLGKKGIVTATQLQATSAILALNREQSLEVQREDPLMFKTFDILYFDGQWLTDKSLIERLRIHRPLLKELQTTGLNISAPMAALKNKRQFFEKIIDNGGEGVVCKRLSGPYVVNGTRQRDGWVKVKRSMSLMSKRSGLDDSIDAFVTGYLPAEEGKGFEGLIGSLIFSCYVRRADGSTYVHEIARVANIPLEQRKSMSIIKDGKLTLDSKYYGRVAAVDGATVSARALRLQHPRLICWRDGDKSADQCIIDEEFLKAEVGTKVVGGN